MEAQRESLLSRVWSSCICFRKRPFEAGFLVCYVQLSEWDGWQRMVLSLGYKVPLSAPLKIPSLRVCDKTNLIWINSRYFLAFLHICTRTSFVYPAFHFVSWWVILSQVWSFWIIFNQVRSFEIILHHVRSFWIILNHDRSFRIVFDHFESCLIILNLIRSFWIVLSHDQTLVVILNNFLLCFVKQV